MLQSVATNVTQTVLGDVTSMTSQTLFDDDREWQTTVYSFATMKVGTDDVTSNDVTTLVTQKVTTQKPWLPWDNPKNVISHATEQMCYLVLACGLCNAICIVGVPFNFLNLAVFAKQGLKDRINILLFSLSLSDFILTAMLLVFRAPCWVKIHDVILARNVETVVNNTVYYVTYIFSSISQFLVAIISVDRCVTLTFPFVAKRMAKVKYTVVAVVGTHLFFFAIFLPHFFQFELVWITDPATNRSVVYPMMTEFMANNAETMMIFSRDLGILAVKPLGTALVVVSSIFTLVQVKRASKSRAQMTSSDSGSADVKITRMLLFLSAVSVVCVVPEVAISYVFIFEPEFNYYRAYHNIFLVMFYVNFVIWSLNSTINFLVYVVMSSKFRRTLLTLFPWLRKCVKAAGQGQEKTSAWKMGQSSNADSVHDMSSAVTEQSAVV